MMISLQRRLIPQYFHGIQGGPLEHIICAKGICFEEAMQPAFQEYAEQVVYNSKIFAQRFISNGWKIISNGTENHMFVIDVYGSIGITGKDAELALDKINITVNKNQIPNDELPPLKSSGIRVGTPAMTTKGWGKDDFIKLADLIVSYLTNWRDACDKNSFNYNDYIAVVENLVK